MTLAYFFERDFIRHVNHIRVLKGLKPIKVNPYVTFQSRKLTDRLVEYSVNEALRSDRRIRPYDDVSESLHPERLFSLILKNMTRD